jgi:hypothetical protein
MAASTVPVSESVNRVPRTRPGPRRYPQHLRMVEPHHPGHARPHPDRHDGVPDDPPARDVADRRPRQPRLVAPLRRQREPEAVRVEHQHPVQQEPLRSRGSGPDIAPRYPNPHANTPITAPQISGPAIPRAVARTIFPGGSLGGWTARPS